MAEIIRMPRMSDTMTEGVIVAWNKKVGDKIKPGDVLAEVETDKATMELESYQEGTILYIGVEQGKAAQVNSILAIIGKEGEDYKALLNDEPKASSAPETSTEEKKPEAAQPEAKPDATAKVSLPAGVKEIRMPLLSDTMTEGKIVSWNKKVGDAVKSDDVLAEVETDKATMEVVGYEEGTLLYIGVEAGQAAKINELIALIGKPGTDVSAYVQAEKSGANSAAATEQSTKEEPVTAPEVDSDTETTTIDDAASGERIKISPLARKLAAEKGYNIASIKGTGDGGRIVKADIDNYTPTAAKAPTMAATPKPTAAEPIAQAQVNTFVAGTEGYKDIQLSQMRKTIARRLGESKFSAPHFYLTMEIVMDNAMASRAAMNEVSPVKISFNDLVIKACALSLRRHPEVNSSFMGDFIRQHDQIHIGSALALPEGLIVPVIKFADQKSLSQIAADAKELYQKARDKKIQPAEFTGNTFTVSNLGMMDIDQFTAIINPPDSAIMAVGRIAEKVVKKDDGFAVINIMKVTLSCDHRSIDGAVGAAFLQTFKQYMENPVTMLV